MAIYDDTEASEKLKVYDSRLNKIAAGKEDVKESLSNTGSATLPSRNSIRQNRFSCS